MGDLGLFRKGGNFGRIRIVKKGRANLGDLGLLRRGTIFQNAKIQSVVVAKCQKELKIPFLNFSEWNCFAKILQQFSNTLHGHNKKLHFRKCLNTGTYCFKLI